jgi:hypothetical protein
MEYLNENCPQVSFVRRTEQILKERKLLYVTKKATDQKKENGTHALGSEHAQEDGILGKRGHPDNGVAEGDLEKRQKLN